MGATASRLPRRSHPVAAVQPQADGDTLTMNPPRALRVVACCLIIHTAVTILLVEREMPLPACKCFRIRFSMAGVTLSRYLI
jgi:hypothetical protein